MCVLITEPPVRAFSTAHLTEMTEDLYQLLPRLALFKNKAVARFTSYLTGNKEERLHVIFTSREEILLSLYTCFKGKISK